MNPETELQICDRCDGEGWIVEPVGEGAAEVTERCPKCKGDGFVEVEAKPAPEGRR